VLACATLVGSRWLGAVAGLLTLAAAGYWIGGLLLLRRLLPVWCFLWLLVPLPLDGDQELIARLQTLTARWTGEVLDCFQVPHVLSGNSIRLVGKELFVEEACSGVQSLYAVLGFTGFLLLWVQATAARSAFLLVAAAGWVLAGNLVRMVTVVCCLKRWDLDLTTGWPHDTLGAILFGLAVALVASTDQLWQFVSADPARTKAAISPAGAVLARTRRPLPVPPWWVGMAFGCLVVPQLAWFLPNILQEYRSHKSIQPILDALADDSLPDLWQGWRRLSFEVATRTNKPFFSDYSRRWTYQKQRLEAVVSVDYPFIGWHALERCYTGLGWTVAASEDRRADGVQFRLLTKPSGRCGYLWFACLDAEGRPLAPPSDTGGARARPLLEEWRHRLAALRPRGNDEAPTFQVQLLIEWPGPLTSAEQQPAGELFAQVCRQFAQPFLAGTETQP
jgi:exosortase